MIKHLFFIVALMAISATAFATETPNLTLIVHSVHPDVTVVSTNCYSYVDADASVGVVSAQCDNLQISPNIPMATSKIPASVAATSSTSWRFSLNFNDTTIVQSNTCTLARDRQNNGDRTVILYCNTVQVSDFEECGADSVPCL